MTSLEKLRYKITGSYFIIVFTILPLFFKNMYFNISQEKWLFFIGCSSLFILFMLTTFVFDNAEHDYIKPLFSDWKLPEFAMFAFVLAYIVSTILSESIEDSFIGASSRYHGLSNVLVYGFVFLFGRKYLLSSRKHMTTLITVGAIVSITAICQYLTWDPIGMYEGVTVQSVHRMISTIGNRNIYASFLSIVLPTTLFFYIDEDNTIKRNLYGLFMALGFAGAIAGNSDSVYIGVFSGLAILLAVGNVSIKNLIRIPGAFSWGSFGAYMLLIAAQFLEKKGVDIRPSQGITAYFTNNTNVLLILFLSHGIIYIILALLLRKYNSPKAIIGRKASYISGGIFISIIVGIFTTLFSSFPFSDEFGSYRGFIWRLAVDDFAKADLTTKLFGYGPETIISVYNSKYYDQMIATTGVVYDNVHCEPLQYLVTTGIVGFLAYMLLTICIISMLYKKARRNRETYMYLIPIFAYLAQSFVNIAQSATTPIFFLIMVLGLASLMPEQKSRLTGKDEFSAQELLLEERQE